ncbi:MAG: hypothetical protein EBY45_11195, partial [Gammaproteobacteria bacterium]|nr:hypothetical protein [Gammaproteobacteria bacterium]
MRYLQWKRLGQPSRVCPNQSVTAHFSWRRIIRVRWYAVKAIPVRNGPPVRRHVFSPKLNVTTVKLVLASTSPYRAELLQRLGMPFEVIDPGVDESLNPGESAAERALRLAKL